MTKPLVIFGASRAAELVCLDLVTAGAAVPEAFIVDPEYKTSDSLQGLPVRDDLAAYAACRFVAAVARPALRRGVTERLVALGLEPAALSASAHDATVQFGTGAYVSRNVALDSYCRLGAFSFIRNGSYVGHDAEVGDFTYCAPRASIGGNAVIGQGCFIGFGSTIRPGVAVGPNCLVAAGAVVSSDVPENTVVSADGRRLGMRDPMRLIARDRAAR